jgi:subtilisin family serine protease
MSVTATHRRVRRAFGALAVLLAVALVLPASMAAREPRGATVPANTTAASTSDGDRLIVTYRRGTTDTARRGIRLGASSKLVRTLDLINADVVKPVGTSLSAAMAELGADPRVAAVQVDHKLALDGDPTAEPDFTYQWALENTGAWVFDGVTSVPDVDTDAAAAWPSVTGAGVTVAVLDSGVDFSHPDLMGQAWVNPGESGAGRETNGVDDDDNGYIDDVNGANVCDDVADNVLYVPSASSLLKHGTAVASVIAGAANGIGMTGIAPDARIMAVRFLVPKVCESDSDAIRAIDYAIGAGARIINASWGGPINSPALQAAVDAANDAGILFVAAAGNVPTSLPHYPAGIDLPNVLSVGAIQANGDPSSFTTYGSWVDMAAPGSSIYAAVASPSADAYGFWDGTSFSAPLVAGAAALLAQADPSLLGQPSLLRRKLIDSGWRGNSAARAKTGSGRILDVANAIDLTFPIQPLPVTAAPRVDTTLGTSTAVTHLVWPYATDASGIDSYRVRYRPASSATWTWATTGTTNRYVDPTLTIARSYVVEVRARDRGGNESVLTFPLKLVRSQENVAAITYTGTWKPSSSSSASNGATKYATGAGASATFSFTGKGVAVIVPKSTTRGSAKVYVDGVYVKTVSTYSSSAQSRRVVFSQTWATSGAHKVKLVVVGTSGHPRVDIDAFVVTQ